MHYIKKNFVVIILVLFGLNEVRKELWPRDIITQSDLDRELMLQESNRTIEIMEIQLTKNSERYEVIEKSVNIDSVMVWNADKRTRDSLRAAINPR